MKSESILHIPFVKNMIEEHAAPPACERLAERGVANYQNECHQAACERLRSTVTGRQAQDAGDDREMLGVAHIRTNTTRDFEHALRFAGWSRSESIYDARHWSRANN